MAASHPDGSSHAGSYSGATASNSLKALDALMCVSYDFVVFAGLGRQNPAGRTARMNDRYTSVAFLKSVDGLRHLPEILEEDQCFEKPSAQNVFIKDVATSKPQNTEAYEDVCRKHPLRGEPVDESNMPRLVCRAFHDYRLRWILEEYAGLSTLPEEWEAAITGPKDPPRWQRLVDLAEGASGCNLRLAPKSWPSVFVTFRPDDPPPDPAPSPGILADALEEAIGLDSGVAERVQHRVAVVWEKWNYLAVLCYDSSCCNECRIPVSPDGGASAAFRPVKRGSGPYGKTRPEPANCCRAGEGCSEPETVHENDGVPADELWIALVGAQK